MERGRGCLFGQPAIVLTGWFSVGFVAELLQGSVAVAPVFHDFDVEVEETFLAGEFFDVFAGFDADFFDGFALVADEDGFLRLALDEDDGADVVDAFFLFVAFDGHFATVGYFLLIVEKELFADDFADEEAHGAVGEFVFGEVGGILGQEVEDVVEDGVDVEPFGSGAGDDDGTGDLVLPVGYLVLDGLLVAEVDFVDGQDDWGLAFDDFGEHLLVFEGLANLGDQQEEVGVLEGTVDEAHHLLVELVVGVDDAWGVGVDDLEVFAVDDAHDAMAGGLGLAGDDAEAFAHEGVHEGGFTYVGIADDVYKS